MPDADDDGTADADEPGRAAPRHPLGYTLDELAEHSGVPARTIRFYRDAGLVASPRREGRRAYYDPEQLARLRLLAQLRSRGLGLDAAGRVLDAQHGVHRSLVELLDVSEVLRRPWIDDRPADLDRTEVLEAVGTTEGAVIDLLEDHDVVVRTSQDPERYHVPSMATLELAGDLAAVGVGPAFAQSAWPAMHRALAPLAGELVRLYLATEGPPETGAPEEVHRRFEALRPIALRALQVAFAHQMEAALASYVASGGRVADEG